MNKRRLDLPLDPLQCQDRLQRCKRRQSTTPERNRMQDEAFIPDRLCAVVDTGGDMHLETGVSGSARHRQPVRKEGEIRIDDVEQPWWR